MRYIFIFLTLLTVAVSAQVAPQVDSLDSRKPMSFVEELPKFPGGEVALLKFMRDSTRYPAEAREKEIEGTVSLQFVILKDGSISDITVKRDIGGGTAQEAIRMVQSKPRWTPAQLNGEPVACYFLLPVIFTDDHDEHHSGRRKKNK